MDWNHANVDKLRQLWALSLSTAEIGRRMGVSKNAVVGKAHRLNLPGRVSPIKRTGHVVTRRAAVAQRKATRVKSLPALPSVVAAPVEAPPPAPTPTPPPRPVLAFSRGCCWPLWGDNERPTHVYCDAAAERVYCPKHAAMAHVKVPARDPHYQVAV